MTKHFYLYVILACVIISCKPEPERTDPNSGNEEITYSLPEVTTIAVTDITKTTAISGGKVISDGGCEVTARGVCWSTAQDPTLENEFTSDSTGVGIFSSYLSDLSQNTTYYLRAYATNSEGTSYGEEVTFTTLDEIIADTLSLPEVETTIVSDITQTTAVSGGNVTSDGGAEVTTRGVCWGISQNPTLENAFSNDGAGVGVYTSQISNITPNTTYYVRAYATNSEGTAYGEEVSFTTLEEIILYPPTVITAQIMEITQTTAVSGGEVISDGGAEVTARGVCWSTNQYPTLDNDYSNDGTGIGSYSSYISNLMPNTTYYVRAYAVNIEGISYGEEYTFNTIDDELINGYEYVDLGLPSGTKWAKYNLGATSSCEYGEFYAWGEIEPKSEYTEANCSSYGVHLPDISGDAQYDAATANWGATWRMPTKAEMEELRDECTWLWTTENNVLGYKIVGPNENYIFLPAVGFILGNTPYFPQQYGYYWTSDPGTDNDFGAFCLYFGDISHDVAWYFRHTGLPIRPVTD